MSKRSARIAIAIVLILLGGIWMLQGGGLVEGSFMSGDRTWLVIGAVVLVAGFALLARTLRQ